MSVIPPCYSLSEEKTPQTQSELVASLWEVLSDLASILHVTLYASFSSSHLTWDNTEWREVEWREKQRDPALRTWKTKKYSSAPPTLPLT